MKIALDLGHGIGQDRGAVGIVSEENIINEVGNKVKDMLRSLGHIVIMTRPSSATTVMDSLSKRVNLANNENVDLFVSIHANCFNTQAHGTEVYTYQGKELTRARNILNNLVGLGFTNRGIKSKELYVTKHTYMRAMLIEICFVDNKGDIDLYNKVGSDKVAQAIVSGLVGQAINIPTQAKEVVNEPIEVKFSANLRDWQQAYNDSFGSRFPIFADGIMGPQTEGVIDETVLKKGMNNPLVGWLQCRIGAKVDNEFGPITENKVKEYQKANGLEVDGIAGPITFRCLLAQFSN